MTKEELLAERGYVCEGCSASGLLDVHHCLIKDMKRYHAILTCRENCQILCRKCHASGYWNGREGRELFWRAQCRRYGESYMREWLASLPLKDKPIF